jgi:hypothetical protein
VTDEIKKFQENFEKFFTATDTLQSAKLLRAMKKPECSNFEVGFQV